MFGVVAFDPASDAILDQEEVRLIGFLLQARQVAAGFYLNRLRLCRHMVLAFQAGSQLVRRADCALS
jgi:hypothetical protein